MVGQGVVAEINMAVGLMGEQVGVLDKDVKQWRFDITSWVDSSTGAINNFGIKDYSTAKSIHHRTVLEMVQEIFMQKYG